MKISQRLLLIIFLLSSFQSVSAMVPTHHCKNTSHSGAHQNHNSQNHSHACCDEDKVGVSESLNSCTFCGDNCQCGSACHITTSSIAMNIGAVLVTAPTTSNIVHFTIVSIRSVELSTEKRPPRTA